MSITRSQLKEAARAIRAEAKEILIERDTPLDPLETLNDIEEWISEARREWGDGCDDEGFRANLINAMALALVLLARPPYERERDEARSRRLSKEVEEKVKIGDEGNEPT